MISNNSVISVIKDAGKILEKAFYKKKSVFSKTNQNDLVTDTDKEIEIFLKTKLSHLLPNSKFLSEETDYQHKKSKYLWIIDPIDGTTNFVHQFPFVCISVALKIEEDLVFSVIYNPILNELFFAEKNQGSYLNNSRIFVSENSVFSKSLLATGFAYNFSEAIENNIRFFEYILPKVHGIRRAGSAALDLAYIAKGVYDGFWEWHLNPWDVCGGILLIEEAGGIVSNINQSKWLYSDDLIIAGSKHIHPQLLNTIKNIM